MEKNLKAWQGWLLFGGAMVVVFGLGVLVSSLAERRAEVASVFNNTRTQFTDSIVSQNEKFAQDYPREYETWAMTEDTTFQSKYNGSSEKDILTADPNIVVLWAGYAFSRDYNTPRGHKHCIEDLRKILRTYAPGVDDGGKSQPGTCWTCKSPDVPRLMAEKGIENYYAAKWADWGNEVVNTVGCSDCHDARTMELRPARPALYEAYARIGKDAHKATLQERRSLVCAQCHVEYYFKKEPANYLTFPWDKGFTCEAAEEYFDEIGFSDFENPLSHAKILKAQHPGFEIAMQGIHAQRGVSCADCHMPYMSEGGIKFSDHHVMSPLAHIDRTCQTCHRQDAETLRQNVYERQQKCKDFSYKLTAAIAKAHLQAKVAWDNGATEQEMAQALSYIRKAQWRWDYSVASHGGSFHAPQEVMRLMADGMDYAKEAQLEIAKVCTKHGVTDIHIPSYSTKEEAQALIGLDMPKLRQEKKQFMETIVPKWIDDAKKNGKLIEL